MPVTLDLTDLLLTKLQIVELNEKDAQDVLYLCSAYPVADGDEPGTIGLARIRPVVGNDWGWWRTVTMNLDGSRPSPPVTAGGWYPRAGSTTPSSSSACCASRRDRTEEPALEGQGKGGRPGPLVRDAEETPHH
jgi:hypothetical protein